MSRHRVRVRPLPPWVDVERLLGPGGWTVTGDEATAELDRRDAADLAARLRGVGLGGHALETSVEPDLPRPAVRTARTEDARRRRETTPGFTRRGVRLDAEGRFSLTPEALALDLGRRAAGRSVVDAFCGAGGNAIGFARAGCPVTAIERDPGRLRDAKHNARVYDVAERIRFLEGDARELLPALEADLLFLDPPWGEAWDRTRTTVDDLPDLREVLPLAARFPETWIKVPPSFAPSALPGAEAEAWFGQAKGDERRVKFVLLRVA